MILNAVKGVLNFIKDLPAAPHPEIYGLHENADITCDQNEAFELFETVLSLQPRAGSSGGVAREDVIGATCAKIAKTVPGPFDIEAIQEKYPTSYYESMNTVLAQVHLGVCNTQLGYFFLNKYIYILF